MQTERCRFSYASSSDPHHIPGDLGQRVCAAHLHGIGQLGGDLVDVALHAFLAAAVDCGDKGQKYAETLASARSAAAIDAVDDVIAPENTKDVLTSALDIMSGKRVSKLPKKHSNIPL